MAEVRERRYRWSTAKGGNVHLSLGWEGPEGLGMFMGAAGGENISKGTERPNITMWLLEYRGYRDRNGEQYMPNYEARILSYRQSSVLTHREGCGV